MWSHDLDSEGRLYCVRTSTCSLGIFPLNYVHPEDGQDDTARAWGGFWDHLSFPSGVAVDNTRGKIYLANKLHPGGGGSWKPSSQLEIWQKEWNTEHIAYKMPPLGSPKIPQQYFPQTVNRAFGTRLFAVTDLAVDEVQGILYVVESRRNRIIRYDLENTIDGVPQEIDTIGLAGTGPSEFRLPVAIDIDAQGNLYVVDTMNNRVQKFDNQGTYVTSWGGVGYGNGQFVYPFDIAVDKIKNYVYVSDPLNDRIQCSTHRDNLLTRLVHGMVKEH